MMFRSFFIGTLVLLFFSYSYSQIINDPTDAAYSAMFRTSSYGTCGQTADLFQTPCFLPRRYSTSDYRSNNTALANDIHNSGFLSIVAVNKTGVPNIYAGLTQNYIFNIVQYSNQPISTTQILVPSSPTVSPANLGQWATALKDSAATMVLFANRVAGSGVIVKYAIDQVTGNLTQVSVLDATSSGLTNIMSGYYEPNGTSAYFIGQGNVIVKVNALNMTVSAVIRTTNLTVSNNASFRGLSRCMLGAGTKLLIASDAGHVLYYDTVTQDLSLLVIPGESFYGACGARAAANYAVLAGFSSGSLYQVTFSNPPVMVYALDNLYPSANFWTGITNSDQSAFYVASYQSKVDPDLRVWEIIYEFRLYDTYIDFSSAVQNVDDSFTGIGAVGIVNNFIYWGTYIPYLNSSQINYVSSIYFMSTSSLASRPKTNYLLVDNSIPVAPNTTIAAPGGIIADKGQLIQTQDLQVTCGVGTYFTPPASGTFPSRGPITTYLRGTNSLNADHGGQFLNNQTLAIRLVSIDEVSQTYTNPSNSTIPLVYRSVPFMPTDVAPWTGTPATPVAIWTWGLGAPSGKYPLTIPPSIRTINGSELKAPGNTKRGLEYSEPEYNPKRKNGKRIQPDDAVYPAFSAFSAELKVYDLINTAPGTILYQNFPTQNSTQTYNTTTRTLSYTFGISSWTYLNRINAVPSDPSPGVLKLNLAVGAGITGKNVVNVTKTLVQYPNITGNYYSNQIFMERTAIRMETCTWTIVLPQVANCTPGGLIPVVYPSLYDNTTGMISVYLPNYFEGIPPIRGFQKGPLQTYTFFVEYEFTPPPTPPVYYSSATPTWKRLIPLYIVLGVCGGLLCLILCGALIAGAIIGIIKFQRWRDKRVEDTLDKSEKMLGDGF